MAAGLVPSWDWYLGVSVLLHAVSLQSETGLLTAQRQEMPGFLKAYASDRNSVTSKAFFGYVRS